MAWGGRREWVFPRRRKSKSNNMVSRNGERRDFTKRFMFPIYENRKCVFSIRCTFVWDDGKSVDLLSKLCWNKLLQRPKNSLLNMFKIFFKNWLLFSFVQLTEIGRYKSMRWYRSKYFLFTFFHQIIAVYDLHTYMRNSSTCVIRLISE